LALFGARHFGQYQFLVTLSDPLSSGAWNITAATTALRKECFWTSTLSLLGRYAAALKWCTLEWEVPASGRPATGLPETINAISCGSTRLTNYLGFVLAARSDLLEQEFRDATGIAAGLDQAGPRKETVGGHHRRAQARGCIAGMGNPEAARDYYNEGFLIWLEADTIIRHETADAPRLDDFCHSFRWNQWASEVVWFTRQDIETALNEVAPYDWLNSLPRGSIK
jgi:predicted metalloprotease with PDZ domain